MVNRAFSWGILGSYVGISPILAMCRRWQSMEKCFVFCSSFISVLQMRTKHPKSSVNSCLQSFSNKTVTKIARGYYDTLWSRQRVQNMGMIKKG